MIGTVRGVFTLVGAGIAGLLIWLSTQIGTGTTGGYWAAVRDPRRRGPDDGRSRSCSAAGRSGGVPRISAGVFLIGFLPVLVVGGWVLLAGQPDANWFQRHVDSWSGPSRSTARSTTCASSWPCSRSGSASSSASPSTRPARAEPRQPIRRRRRWRRQKRRRQSPWRSRRP